MSRLVPSRRLVLAGLAGVAAPAHAAATSGLTAAEVAIVNRATVVLEALTEAQGRFVQTDARGATTEGRIYLKRPGKARFAYDPPSGLTVVSDGSVVSIADKRLKTFERYPLSATPLALFLARRIRLDKSVLITRATQTADGFQITARDGAPQDTRRDHPELRGRPRCSDRLDGGRRARVPDPGPAYRPPGVVRPRPGAVPVEGPQTQGRRASNVTIVQQASLLFISLAFF